MLHNVLMLCYFMDCLIGSATGRLSFFQFMIAFALGMLVDYLYDIKMRLMGVSQP